MDPDDSVRRIFYSEDEQWKKDTDKAAYNAMVRDSRKLVPTGGYKVDGATFCSLKCANAYAASKGIKEERLCIIYGE